MTNKEILALMPDIKRVIASILRNSRWYDECHVEECMSDVMLQVLDYGIKHFDPGKGSARSHFTCFAKNRAINWLNVAHRRFESVGLEAIAELEAGGTPEVDLVREQELATMRQAIASLEPREQALLEAYERFGTWSKAAESIGVSQVTASRMKSAIIAKLR